MRAQLRHLAMLPLALLVCAAPASVRAQEEELPAREEPSFMDQFLADAADSAGALDPADSIAAAAFPPPAGAILPPPPPWYDPLIPTVDGRVNSSVANIISSAGIEAPIGEFLHLNGRARFGVTNTQYRQFDRDALSTNFRVSLDGGIPSWGELDLTILRDTSHDENRLPPRPPDTQGEVLILDYDAREIHAALVGSRELSRGFRVAWGVHGDIEDVDRTDKGVANDRSLAGGGGGGVWGHRGPWHDFTARYGYDRKIGTRILRTDEADALTERDTLWARGRVDLGARLLVNMDARRTSFVEDRLDFARNVNGVVDTVGIRDPVGDEHESAWQTSWNVDVTSRVLPRLSVAAGAGRTYSEDDHTYSREGLVLLSNDDFDAQSTLRYAAAGSLRVRYSYVDRANNRRARGTDRFRGEEARVSQQAEAFLRHRAAPRIDVHIDLQQTLDQNINQAADNLNDRDRLITRTDFKILADPWDWFGVDAAAAYSYEQEINIDAARVANNQDADLFEVRGSFILDPEGGWRFIQDYRMQIRLIDRVATLEGDEFNKQGQWNNRAEYRFPNGVFTDAQYIVDYRRNGDRDLNSPEDDVYVYGGPRRDHRALFGVRVPVAGMELSMATERGFLRDDSGFTPVDEDRGKISMGVRGSWQFWRDRGMLSLNATQILQFGPKVRDDQKDYWVMDTSVRVAF